ncbi:hypothetical protein MBANPS3_007139 [Mucor bainieri]
MSPITSLPNELLFNIFSRFDKLAHLAECRLVCKAWRDPVEREMLGHTITFLPDIRKMNSLYDFLQIDPARTHLIKHLRFEDTRDLYTEDEMAFVNRLFEVIATSDIESIAAGYHRNVNLFQSFVDVVRSHPNNLSKLKILKFLLSEYQLPSYDLAFHCRKTIQTMELDFFEYVWSNMIDWKFMDRLIEFQHLTSFTLTAAIQNIANLNRIMDNCPHLQELSLSIVDWDYDREDRLDLNQKAGKIHCTLKRLKIYDEYFLYKLANLQKISIKVDADIRLDVEEEIVNIPKLIQRVPMKEMVYGVSWSDPSIISSYLKDAGYTVEIVACSSLYYSDYIKVIL